MRDPRMDPANGDMLRLRDERERHVLGTHDEHFTARGVTVVRYFDVRKSGNLGERRCSLAAWRKWAASPEIVIAQRLDQ